MSGRRAEQMSSIIHRAVQSVLSGGLSDPRLDAMLTVTNVRVSSDRRQATVSVSVLPEERESRVIHGLRDAARHIRREAADLIDVHRMPDLIFKLDRTIKKQAAIHDALHRVREEIGEESDPQDQSHTESVSGDEQT
jgi:ribosome-binding factor A